MATWCASRSTKWPGSTSGAATTRQEVASILRPRPACRSRRVALAASRYSYGVKPISPQVLGEQQKIADAFHNLKLIPKPLVVRDAQPPAELLNQLLVKE
jgi:sulfonate transport system substrate-binding protein